MECRLRNHPKEPQGLFNCRLLVGRAEVHLRVVGLGLVVALALDDAVLTLHLRDVQGRDVQASLRLDVRLDFAIGGFALGLGHTELIRVDADPDDIIGALLDQQHDGFHMARYVHFDVRASRCSRKQIQPISSENIEIFLVRFKSISSREHIHYFRKPA